MRSGDRRTIPAGRPYDQSEIVGGWWRAPTGAREEEEARLFGCLKKDEKGNGPFWCGESKTKMDALEAQLAAELQKHQIRSSEEVAKVKADIRKVTEKPNLEVTFGGKFSNPYTEKTEKKVEYYADSNNNGQVSALIEHLFDIDVTKFQR